MGPSGYFLSAAPSLFVVFGAIPLTLRSFPPRSFVLARPSLLVLFAVVLTPSRHGLTLPAQVSTRRRPSSNFQNFGPPDLRPAHGCRSFVAPAVSSPRALADPPFFSSFQSQLILRPSRHSSTRPVPSPLSRKPRSPTSSFSLPPPQPGSPLGSLPARLCYPV